MKKVFLVMCFSVFYLGAFGDHIVGGEIEFITLDPGLYRINLIQYRDALRSDDANYETTLEVYIYSNLDDRVVSKHTLTQVSLSDVPYTNPECASDLLKTSKVVYSSDVALDPENYQNKDGYYIVWERCCRNAVIKNINNSGKTGMKYVLEIPPLWQSGKPFINSSPTLLRPLSDYACINQLYYTDFTGTDADGDSLAYRLTTPLNSSSLVALPEPRPKPHIPLRWASGYDLANVVPGKQPLQISRSGLLTVNPSTPGVYVFSVIVEEWRDGSQIGETQRDFQMLVIDGCEPPDPPVVGIAIPGNPDFDPEVEVLRYELADDKCFEFVVTNITPGETISLRAQGVNFGGNIDEIFTIKQQLVGSDQDTLLLEVCAPGCPPYRDRPFIVDLIAADDACPVPQLDTARITIAVEPPPNTFPTVENAATSYTINEGDVLEVVFDGVDIDNDSVALALIVPGLSDPALLGLSMTTVSQEAGKTTGLLRWDTNCQTYDFSDWQSFNIGLVAEDDDICEYDNPNIFWVNLEVVLPLNTSPVVNKGSPDSVMVILGDDLNIQVFASDDDLDLINLRMIGDGFNAASTGAQFEAVDGHGSVESFFQWQVRCGGIVQGSSRAYDFIFIAEDADPCELRNADSTTLRVYVEIPENQSPVIEEYPDMTLEVGEPFEMEITAFDSDELDSVYLEFFNPARLPKSETLSFEPAAGQREVTSIFSWTPECSLLDAGAVSSYYQINFLAYDNNCQVVKLDTMSIVFELMETREEFLGFQPPNVFTPNGDGVNDVFTLTNLKQPMQNLPADNCDDIFQSISIHDRSGAVVYKSDSREFGWDAKNVSNGVYYYAIQYSHTEYKGYIQVLR